MIWHKCWKVSHFCQYLVRSGLSYWLHSADHIHSQGENERDGGGKENNVFYILEEVVAERIQLCMQTFSDFSDWTECSKLTNLLTYLIISMSEMRMRQKQPNLCFTTQWQMPPRPWLLGDASNFWNPERKVFPREINFFAKVFLPMAPSLKKFNPVPLNWVFHYARLSERCNRPFLLSIHAWYHDIYQNWCLLSISK